jgi:cytochrome c553
VKKSYEPVPKAAPVLKAPKRMRARSRSTAERDARYTVERDAFLDEHQLCEAHWDQRCTKVATEVHHMAGRARAVFFRKSWWLAVCGACHHAITTKPADAFERGLSFHRNWVDA